MVGARFAGVGAASAAAMVMRNGPIESVALPSDTVISMSSVWPTFAAVGVPDSVPFATLNCAHAGSPVTVNDSASLSASLACGANEYRTPAFAVSAGVPSRTGALLVGEGSRVVGGGVGSTAGCGELLLA